jgi:hypothetical protein
MNARLISGALESLHISYFQVMHPSKETTSCRSRGTLGPRNLKWMIQLGQASLKVLKILSDVHLIENKKRDGLLNNFLAIHGLKTERR